MAESITYPIPAPAVAINTDTNITTTEADLVTVTDLKYFQKSQVSAYYQVTLNSATQVNSDTILVQTDRHGIVFLQKTFHLAYLLIYLQSLTQHLQLYLEKFRLWKILECQVLWLLR